MIEQKLHLNLGDAAVCLKFPSKRFADKAVQQIVLNAPDKQPVVGKICFVEDNSVQALPHPPCKPNAVYIKKEAQHDVLEKVTLRIFDKYTIVLKARDASVSVQYPGQAPASLLLDDVLQAALHWILERVGGFILHGSCAVRDNEAIAIMGISGAGKSTTAFNLTRLGFQCYADDAVLVVPEGDQLIVRPFTRELSIRPLTFKLLKAHGLEMADYRKEGEKYFFKPAKAALAGARLKCACLVEVSGENTTEITHLSREQFERALVAERKHFTFMERESAEKYASVLADCVPIPIHAAVGSDLDVQGQAIEAVFEGTDLSVVQMKSCLPMMKGRKHKKEIIRSAWSQPEHPPIATIIPLLNDYDLQVLKLAFGFFQNFSMGKLEPVATPAPWQGVVPKFENDWLQASEWLDGCRQLVEASPVEVFQKFAYPWVKSAPLIYPFLRFYASLDPDKREHVDGAWARYKQDNNAAVEKNNIRQVSLLFDQDHPGDAETISDTLQCLKNMDEITVIPVFDFQHLRMDPIIDFIQKASANGFKAQLSRHVPLCVLSPSQAQRLFNGDGIECAAIRGPINGLMNVMNEAGDQSVTSCLPVQDIHRMVDNLYWDDQPFAACSTCGSFTLGLCRGGVSKADSKKTLNQ